MIRECISCKGNFPEDEMIQDGTMFDEIPGDWYCEDCYDQACEHERDEGLKI